MRRALPASRSPRVQCLGFRHLQGTLDGTWRLQLCSGETRPNLDTVVEEAFLHLEDTSTAPHLFLH
jgi:hypothetical protein